MFRLVLTRLDTQVYTSPSASMCVRSTWPANAARKPHEPKKLIAETIMSKTGTRAASLSGCLPFCWQRPYRCLSAITSNQRHLRLTLTTWTATEQKVMVAN